MSQSAKRAKGGPVKKGVREGGGAPRASMADVAFGVADVYATGANALAQMALAPWSLPPAVRQVAAAAVMPAARRRPATLLAVLAIFALCSFALARAGRVRSQ